MIPSTRLTIQAPARHVCASSTYFATTRAAQRPVNCTARAASLRSRSTERHRVALNGQRPGT
eukprot:6644956-Lingulodinium_polyedra.AAC.1